MKKLVLGLTVTLLFAASVTHAQKPADKKAPAPAAAPAAAAPAAAAPAAAAPAAAPAGPPPAPKPGPEMDQLKFLLGKWKCDGKAFASPMTGPEHAIKGSVDNKLEGEGFWQVWTYEEKKTKEHPGLKVHGMWGWDGGMKKLVRAAGDNHGIWDTATTPGMDGDKILWTGDFSGPMGKMPFHHTFVKKGDKEWTHTVEVKAPDGKWMPTEEVTCKK
jgi:hypothetical protein